MVSTETVGERGGGRLPPWCGGLLALIKRLPGSMLGKRLVLSITFASSLLALVISVVELISDYRWGISQLEQTHRQVEQIYSASLADSLWSMNDVSTLELVAGIARLDDVQHVVLHWDGGGAISAGVELADPALYSRLVLTRDHGGRAISCGCTGGGCWPRTYSRQR